MPEVDPNDVIVLLDKTDTAAAVEQAVPIVTTMCKAFTRGRGFTGNVPNDELGAVITTAAARFVSNPSQLNNVQTIGPFVEDWRGGFTGWTLAELAVLNRYRVRAM